MAWTTTLAPSTSGVARLSTVLRWTVSGTEMSATASRSTMKTVLRPGRRLIWAIWPSTQTAPSRSTYCEIRLAIWRTGAGDCAEVSRAMVGH